MGTRRFPRTSGLPHGGEAGTVEWIYPGPGAGWVQCSQTMYQRCLVCRDPFPETGVLKHLPRGDRFACDLDRGRLWMVCGSCQRWSLVAMEERWDALKEIDRCLGGDHLNGLQPKVLFETENIALFRVGPLEVIRIEAAEAEEEASWRYGPRPGGRGGGDHIWPQVPTRLPKPPKSLRKGTVWRGRKRCLVCQHLFTDLAYFDRKILVVRPGGGTDSSQGLSLTRRCPMCRDAEEGGLHLGGFEGELVLFRLLAFEHHMGAPIDRVRSAARMAQDPDGPGILVQILTQYGRPLGDIPPVGVLALEMVTAAAREETHMRMAAAELTFRWRREEELAALVDGELTPVTASLWGRLIRRVRGTG
jgi:hypothetical protein